MFKKILFFTSICSVALADVVNISSGSSSGYTMSNGNTYVINNSVSFSNSTAGGNGITVADNATVVIYVPTNVTLTAKGANGSGQTGGGAGIYVPSTATLVITGEGTVNATGGNAGNGAKGSGGGNGELTYKGSRTYSQYLGNGGKGGAGGGGSGSGIGGNGGTGGSGGSGGSRIGIASVSSEIFHNGNPGEAGSKGGTATSMGKVFAIGNIIINAVEGNAANSGAAGANGSSQSLDIGVCFGGGGGGGGGAGAAAKYGIGGGGSSGGGGGGGGTGGGFSKVGSLSVFNLTGGGGSGGKSSAKNGISGSAAGSAVLAEEYSLHADAGTYKGGAGGAGGSAGSDGGHGTLYASQKASLNTTRSCSSAETHTAAQYAITFSENGGILSSSSRQTIATLGVELPVAIPSPRWLGADFSGWATEPNGGTMYYDAGGNPLLSCYTNPAPMTLYAQWSGPLAGANFSLETSPDYWWQTTISEDLPGGYLLQSATIPDGTNSWMSTTVTGPGKIGFDWKVSCENRYAYLQVLVDGTQKKRITANKDWESLEYEIAAGEHTVMWRYVKDGAAAVGDDAGFVRNIAWRPYLSFVSSSEHGTAVPADSESYLYDDVIDASVDATVVEGATRYVCDGWTGTGSAPASGSSNAVSFVLREDSSLAWNWRTNFWTSLAVSGPATADFSSAWLEKGANVTVTVAKTVPFIGIALSGDTEGVTLSGTNITFAATRPREIEVSVTEITYASALETEELVWRTGGDGAWFPEYEVTHDGADACQSGALSGKGASSLETVVIGPGTLSFWWKFAADSSNGGLDLMIDGEYFDGLTDTTDWTEYTCEIGPGRHVIRWEYWTAEGGASAAFLDSVAWDGGHPVDTYTAVNVTGPATADFTGGWLADSSNMVVHLTPSVNYYKITLSGDTEGVTLTDTVLTFEVTQARTINVLVEELTFEAALDSTGIRWRTGGDVVWFPETETTSDGTDAASSGGVANKGISWLETTVIGPGTFSFKYKLATAGTRCGTDLMIDGEYYDGFDSDADWTTYTADIDEGTHVVRFEFWCNDSSAAGATYIDCVSWDGAYPTATATLPVAVPYDWMDEKARAFVTRHYGDYEAAGAETAANGENTVWECFVSGVNPSDALDALRAVIAVTNEVPYISWTPKLPPEEEALRTYTILGKADLATDVDWLSPTNATHRFFKVKVEMK